MIPGIRMSNRVKFFQISLVVLLLISGLSPAIASQPSENVSPPPMDPGNPYQGAITGRITTQNTSQVLPGAYVAIVNAANVSQAFYEGRTNESGFYYFPAVNNTVAGDSTVLSYKVFAYMDGVGEGISNQFGVSENSVARVDLAISAKPAKIVVTASRNNIAADDNDHVKITAYVTDFHGDPVDGAPIDFWVSQDPWASHVNGSLSLDGNFAPGHSVLNVTTRDGWASVTFGWVSNPYTGGNSNIDAWCASDPAIRSRTNIAFGPVDSTTTSSGFEVQHIPMPDEIRLSPQPDTIVTGGNGSMITAQLYYNGTVYQRSGVTVTFFTDNETTGYLSAIKNIASDANGRATINLTSGNATGDVNVTGFTKIGISRNLTGTCMVHVVNRTADIVTVTNSTALQNATEDLRTNVTLENKTPVDTLSTPTLTTSGSSSGVPDAGVILAILAVLVVAGGAVFFLLLKRK